MSRTETSKGSAEVIQEIVFSEIDVTDLMIPAIWGTYGERKPGMLFKLI
jgi:hypothetical protein